MEALNREQEGARLQQRERETLVRMLPGLIPVEAVNYF